MNGALNRNLIRFFCLLSMVCLLISGAVANAEEQQNGYSQERIDEIEEKIGPVLKGMPVIDLPEEDRPLLFIAEELFADSFELFLRHAEYLADEKADYTQAIPRFKRALEIDPEAIEIFEKLAQCHEALKQAADAVSCWETLRELLDDEETAKNRELRQRVMVNLERMAKENAMIMRQGKRFIIYTPADSSFGYVAEELTDRRLEEVYLQITGDLACVPAFRTSILVLTPAQFDKVSPTSWAGGFASGGKSMTLPADSFSRSEPEARLPNRKLLLHEFTHNIVFIMGEGSCPTWLNEGLAVFAEQKDDSFTEFKPSLPAPEEVMSLDDLEKEFMEIRKLEKGNKRVRNAYRLAGLYARYLIQNFTMATPRQIINSMKSSGSFEQALQLSTEWDVAKFESNFRGWIQELTY